MVIIKLQGGLGNQMFQYAFGKTIANKLNSPLYFNLTFFEVQHLDKNITNRNLELSLFDDKLSIASERMVADFLNAHLQQRMFNKLGILKKIVYREKSLRFSADVFNISPPVYFDGFWQCERYFKTNEELIRGYFTFNKPLNAPSQKLADELAVQENTVSVHIRRGDYISSAQTNELHGSCSVKYYQKAIELIKSKLTDPVVYFFSDDTDWVSKNLLNNTYEATIVDYNNGADSWQDMALMRRCKHHIIANSSFSWWGAWLNPAKEKIVIAPEKWFNKTNEYFDDTDIVPANWIKLPND